MSKALVTMRKVFQGQKYKYGILKIVSLICTILVYLSAKEMSVTHSLSTHAFLLTTFKRQYLYPSELKKSSQIFLFYSLQERS